MEFLLVKRPCWANPKIPLFSPDPAYIKYSYRCTEMELMLRTVQNDARESVRRRVTLSLLALAMASIEPVLT
jgi:hypothetical protein